MNIRTLVEQAAQLAHTAAQVIPGTSMIEAGVEVGGKILDVLDALKPHAPDNASSQQLEAAHVDLMKHLQEKGLDLSNRLRGQ